jgi:hypothetical protein
MLKYGPQTFAEKRAESVRIPGVRVSAPNDLEPAEVVIWDSIVIRLPEDWFTSETIPILKAYCRHSAYADQFACDITAQRSRIETLRAGSQNRATAKQLTRANDHLHALHRMHMAETGQAMSCATRLRLTNQSRYVKETAASKARRSPIAAGAPPWHDWSAAGANA